MLFALNFLALFYYASQPVWQNSWEFACKCIDVRNKMLPGYSLPCFQAPRQKDFGSEIKRQ